MAHRVRTHHRPAARPAWAINFQSSVRIGPCTTRSREFARGTTCHSPVRPYRDVRLVQVRGDETCAPPLTGQLKHQTYATDLSLRRRLGLGFTTSWASPSANIFHLLVTLIEGRQPAGGWSQPANDSVGQMSALPKAVRSAECRSTSDYLQTRTKPHQGRTVTG